MNENHQEYVQGDEQGNQAPFDEFGEMDDYYDNGEEAKEQIPPAVNFGQVDQQQEQQGGHEGGHPPLQPGNLQQEVPGNANEMNNQNIGNQQNAQWGPAPQQHLPPRQFGNNNQRNYARQEVFQRQQYNQMGQDHRQQDWRGGNYVPVQQAPQQYQPPMQNQHYNQGNYPHQDWIPERHQDVRGYGMARGQSYGNRFHPIRGDQHGGPQYDPGMSLAAAWEAGVSGSTLREGNRPDYGSGGGLNDPIAWGSSNLRPRPVGGQR